MAADPTACYSSEPTPLLGYAVLAAAWNAAFGAGLAAAVRSGRVPERIEAGDIALLGVGTHKLSRLLAKDRVTSFLRAPFTRYEESGGPGEVEETARGTGLRRATGELLVCPNCLGLWVASGFTLSFLFAPRTTRTLAAMLAVLTASDVLQLAYAKAEGRR
jgi:hypothetical protein